jgi:hypothetical protein
VSFFRWFVQAMPALFWNTIGFADRKPDIPKVIAAGDCTGGGGVLQIGEYLIVFYDRGVLRAELVIHEFSEFAQAHEFI